MRSNRISAGKVERNVNLDGRVNDSFLSFLSAVVLFPSMNWIGKGDEKTLPKKLVLYFLD
jgi:hypothetical protein